MQQIKKYLLAVFMIAVGATYCAAQATDTIELSVLNTGVKYRLIVAAFGKPQTGAELLTDMVFVHDTVVSYVVTPSDGTSFMPAKLLVKMPDSLRRAFQSQKKMKPVITNRCDKPITTNVKDRVVLMQLGACDPSVMCLNAQNAGAKAVVLIHSSNKIDSILLKKMAGRAEIKITCYTVTRATGAKIAALLPSHVGIKKRVNTSVQALTTTLTDSARAAIQAQQDAVAKAEYDAYIAKNSFTGIGWQIAPNPVHEEAELVYNFEKRANFMVEVFNEIGQLVTNYQLPDAQRGKLNIDVSAWQNGTYNVSVSSGSFRQNKHLVVAH